MPLQDKNRMDRKVTARKIVCIDTGQIFANASDMAEQLEIATQTVYNIIRRGQTYRGMRYEYMQKGGGEHGSRTEETNARGHNAENG